MTVAVVLALSAAGCGDGPTAGSDKPSATPSPSYEKATVRACALAKKSKEGTNNASFKAAEDAVSAASTSDVAALREIAEKYAPQGTSLDNIHTDTGALKISTWCLDHEMG